MSLPKNCPICKKNSHKIEVVTRHVYGGGNSAFFKCLNCKIIFQFPFMSKNEEKKFYQSEFEKFMQRRAGDGKWKHAEDNNKLNLSTYLRRAKYFEKYLNKKVKNILEIGCSSGFMIKPLIERGFNCYGIEPSGKYQNYLKSEKIKLFSDMESIIKKKLKFDLIIHFFVFEHIRDPLSFINMQKKILNRNGKIIFEIPCYDDPLYKVYDLPEFERFYWSKVHPFYYNKESLEYVLKKKKLNFKIFLDQRYNLSNHYHWVKHGRPGGQDKYKNIISKQENENYKKKILKKGFGDTLVCIIENE